MRRSLDQIRGVVLVETSLVMPLLLVLMFTIITFGIFGMRQLGADAAAFDEAHFQYTGEYYALIHNLPFVSSGSGLSANTYTESLINLNVPTGSALGPNYGMKLSSAMNDTGSGAFLTSSPIQVVAQQTWGTKIPFFGPILGTMQGVSLQDNINFFSVGTFPLIPTLVEGAGGLTGLNANQVNTEQNETFQSLNMAMAGGFKKSILPYNNPHWTVCPDTPGPSNLNTLSMVGFGDAARIDTFNNGRSKNGLWPRGTGGNTGAVFWEVLDHQQVFARAVQALWNSGPMPATLAASDPWALLLFTNTDVATLQPADATQPSLFDTRIGGSITAQPSNTAVGFSGYQISPGSY